MEKRAVLSPAAAAPVGPYSQAIAAGGLLFCSGCIPLDATGKAVGGGIAAETEQVLKNLRAILEAGGSGMERVVKTTVFLVDLEDFAAMNEVYARHFLSPAPARSTVQVSRLPRGARVEIEALALLEA